METESIWRIPRRGGGGGLGLGRAESHVTGSDRYAPLWEKGKQERQDAGGGGEVFSARSVRLWTRPRCCKPVPQHHTDPPQACTTPKHRGTNTYLEYLVGNHVENDVFLLQAGEMAPFSCDMLLLSRRQSFSPFSPKICQTTPHLYTGPLATRTHTHPHR